LAAEAEDGTDAEDDARHAGLAYDDVRAPAAPVLRRREDAIERGEETAKESARRVLRSRPENQRALRGLVGERVHHREQDRERDRERELAVERSGDAEDEPRRDEDARQHEGDADERS